MRNKIDYGIDLGTTNSAIVRMENGKPVVKKTDKQADTLPSCVFINKKKEFQIGEIAFHNMKANAIRALKYFRKDASNTFTEFKRDMGTTVTYPSSNLQESISPIKLSAEVLKTLKSFIQDENISSIVITVPAKFRNPQIEATIQAAKLAGFKHVELLQEPVAAATAYGLTTKDKDSYWLVFDFGGGTFDAAIIKSEEGILTVKDTEGDNRLGGKDLDIAIVDTIIIPNLQNNYAIDRITENTETREVLRNALKFFAEEAKIQLSFKDSHNILSNFGDLPFEDENGEEPEIDITVNQKDMENVLSPIFQKAIDITKGLLKRNNLNGADLGALILVGGPTYSPILRRMLKEQITEKIPTEVDPMTVVAKGAALFASTISVSEEEIEIGREKNKLQLEIDFPATTVETKESINIKILKDKTEGIIPEQVFADVVRDDGAWSCGKKQIGEKKILIDDVLLQEGCSNGFTINLYDGQGNKLECQPNKFSILQGIGGLEGMSVLPYYIGIGKWFDEYEENRFEPFKGLEKTKKLPATGVINDLKTRNIVRPGIAIDTIRIPIYQGAYQASGTNPDLNYLVDEVFITGESIPALLQENSPVAIRMKVNRSGNWQMFVDFPSIDHTEEVPIRTKPEEPPTTEELVKKIADAKRTARRVNDTVILNTLEELENQLENEKGSPDGKMKILNDLREELLKLAKADKSTTFPKIEKELKEIFFELEDLIRKIKQNGYTENLKMNRIDAMLEDIRQKVDFVISGQKIKEAKDLIKAIDSFDYNLRNEVTGGASDVQTLNNINQDFNYLHWKNPTKARQLINQALQQVVNGNKRIRPLLIEIVQLLPLEEQPGNGTLG